MTPSHRFLALAALITMSACRGTGNTVVQPAPAAPEAAVVAFLSAVDSNDIALMAQLWGTERGPSTAVVRNAEERERRLVVIQRVLEHNAFRFVPAPHALLVAPGRRVLWVELSRGDRRATVPFTVVGERSGGWLVEDIGLEAVMSQPGPRRP